MLNSTLEGIRQQVGHVVASSTLYCMCDTLYCMSHMSTSMAFSTHAPDMLHICIYMHILYIQCMAVLLCCCTHLTCAEKHVVLGMLA